MKGWNEAHITKPPAGKSTMRRKVNGWHNHLFVGSIHPTDPTKIWSHDNQIIYDTHEIEWFDDNEPWFSVDDMIKCFTEGYNSGEQKATFGWSVHQDAADYLLTTFKIIL